MAITVESRFRNVEKLVAAAQAKGLDPETASYYCKLGGVMICGAVEQSVGILIIERIGDRSAPQVTLFLRAFFRRGTNYDCEAIKQLLYRFDTNWGNRFTTFVDANDRIKGGVASCYAIRNSVAHGGSVSLSPHILRQYYEDSFNLIAELENILHS